MTATVENLRGSVEGAQPPRFCCRGLAQGKSRGSPHTAPQQSVGIRGILLRGQFFPNCPKDFQQLLRLSKSWGSFASGLALSISGLASSSSGLNPFDHIDIELPNKVSRLEYEASPLTDEASPLTNEAYLHQIFLIFFLQIFFFFMLTKEYVFVLKNFLPNLCRLFTYAEPMSILVEPNQMILTFW